MIYKNEDDLPQILAHALQVAGGAYQLDKMLGYPASRGRQTRHAKRGHFTQEYKKRLLNMFTSEAEKRALRAQRIMAEWRERRWTNK